MLASKDATTFSDNSVYAEVGIKTGTLNSDPQYVALQKTLLKLAGKRDVLATKIKTTLESAEFDGVAPSKQVVNSDVHQCQAILSSADALVQ